MKKLNTINSIQSDSTAAAATGISSKGAVGKVNAQTMKGKKTIQNREIALAVEVQRRKDAEKYGRDMYKLSLAMAAALREYGSAERARAEVGYRDINSRTVDAVKVQTVAETKKFIEKRESGNGAKALHTAEEFTTAAAARNEATPDKPVKKAAAPKKTTKKAATTKTAEKPAAKPAAYKKGRRVKFDELYTVKAKNGTTYSVGKFERTDNGETAWAVFLEGENYSVEARDWLRSTFKVTWSQYAMGYLFPYKPDSYLRKGVAKKAA